MSRKYLNDRWCVRCGKKTCCPYLRDNYEKLFDGKSPSECRVVDIGCGNGRNSEFMKSKGCHVVSVDMADDYGEKMILGEDPLPVKDHSIDIILANYVLMFLNAKERNQVIREIKRVASENCMIILELYPAKDSFAKNDEEMAKMQEQIFKKIGWEKIRYRKGKFIAKKTGEANG
jgi:SAM-dependent methyltransferase